MATKKKKSKSSKSKKTTKKIQTTKTSDAKKQNDVNKKNEDVNKTTTKKQTTDKKLNPRIDFRGFAFIPNRVRCQEQRSVFRNLQVQEQQFRFCPF